MVRAVAIWGGMYLLCLIFSFVSEITYRKRTIQDVCRNWRTIVVQTSSVFAVFTISSIIWYFLRLK